MAGLAGKTEALCARAVEARGLQKLGREHIQNTVTIGSNPLSRLILPNISLLKHDIAYLYTGLDGLRKRGALKELLEVTREGAVRLWECAEGLRQLRSESCRVASTGQALEESFGANEVINYLIG